MIQNSRPVRIILADDHAIFRQGLKTLIEHESDMEVVGEAENGRRCIELARHLNPDTIIMDITLPELNGIEATRFIHALNPDIKIIALSMHSNHLFVEEMDEAGANGYLLKSCVFDDLVIAIRTVMQNSQYFSSKLKRNPGGSASSTVNGDNASAPFSILTKRECEVLRLIADGKTTKEISEKLFISIKTVEKHRHSIKEKLNLRMTADLTKYAIQTKLTTLDF